jgi:hypothetical protein
MRKLNVINMLCLNNSSIPLLTGIEIFVEM